MTPPAFPSRRALLGGLGAAALASPALVRPGLAQSPAQSAAPSPAWTYEAFQEAMQKSGRNARIGAQQFAAIQARKPAAMRRIERYLTERLGAADPAVMAAFHALPREYFHYLYSANASTATDAYEEVPKPWGLGYGSALSDYLGQAYMTQICEAKPDHTVLEIGTGSGFQIALLSRMVKAAYSIEIIEPLGHAVSPIFAPLGYDNVQTRVGDGYFGWPEVGNAPGGGFDVIIVTCAAQYAPPELFKQMKPGGRMIIPIGQPFKRGQVLYVYSKDAEGKIHSRRDMGVFFIPMTGAMMQQRPPGRPSAT